MKDRKTVLQQKVNMTREYVDNLNVRILEIDREIEEKYAERNNTVFALQQGIGKLTSLEELLEDPVFVGEEEEVVEVAEEIGEVSS